MRWPISIRRYRTLEISDTIYGELEKEAQHAGLSVSDLHREIYRTYFAMMHVIRSEDSELIIRQDGVEYILREDSLKEGGLYSLEEVLSASVPEERELFENKNLLQRLISYFRQLGKMRLMIGVRFKEAKDR